MRRDKSPRDTWDEGLFVGALAEPKFRRRVLAGEQVLRFLLSAREEMALNNISQRELANRMGVSPTQVNRWFRTETGLNAKTMFTIAMALGFDLETVWQPIRSTTALTPISFEVESRLSDYSEIQGPASSVAAPEAEAA